MIVAVLVFLSFTVQIIMTTDRPSLGIMTSEYQRILYKRIKLRPLCIPAIQAPVITSNRYWEGIILLGGSLGLKILWLKKVFRARRNSSPPPGKNLPLRLWLNHIFSGGSRPERSRCSRPPPLNFNRLLIFFYRPIFPSFFNIQFCIRRLQNMAQIVKL